MFIVPVCPCLSLVVPVCPCLSLVVLQGLAPGTGSKADYAALGLEHGTHSRPGLWAQTLSALIKEKAVKPSAHLYTPAFQSDSCMTSSFLVCGWLTADRICSCSSPVA